MSIDVQSISELPMHVLTFTADRPGNNIREGLPHLMSLCDALVQDVSMLRRGPIPADTQRRVEVTDQITRILSGRPIGEPSTGKEIAAAKKLID